MTILNTIVGAIARYLHPDKPREVFANWSLPTDLSADEVKAKLDEAAKANPGFKNWRTSIVDLMKLTHPDNPDAAASMENRAALAKELGDNDYDGKPDENTWLHNQVFKAIQHRGIKMPGAD